MYETDVALRDCYGGHINIDDFSRGGADAAF
jgi:hypothetical protein